MKRKLLLFFSIMLLGMCSLYSQEIDFTNPILKGCCPKMKDKIDSVLTNAPFVFEGELVKQVHKEYKAENGKIYDSYLVRIDKVLRGYDKLYAGAIEIVVEHAGYMSEFGMPSFGKNHWYVFICKDANVKGSLNADNKVKLELYEREIFHSYFQNYGRIKNGEISYFNEIYSGMLLNFETKHGVRRFLKEYGIISRNPKPIVQIKSSNINKLPISVSNEHVRNVE